MTDQTTTPAEVIARPKVYFASKAKWAPTFRGLEDLHLAGRVEVASSWIYLRRVDSYVDLWQRAISEVISCDAVIAMHEPGEEWKGAFVEIGAALAHGIPVLVVGDPPGSWVNHPLVSRFETVRDACDAAAGFVRPLPDEEQRREVELEEQVSAIWGPSQFDWVVGRSPGGWFYFCGTVATTEQCKGGWKHAGHEPTLVKALERMIALKDTPSTRIRSLG